MLSSISGSCLTNSQIRDYPRFLKEIARLLRPGGLVLLIEPDLHPVFSNTSIPVAAPQRSSTSPFEPVVPSQPSASTSSGAGVNPIMVQTAPVSTLPSSATDAIGNIGLGSTPGDQRGWIGLWETYRTCLRLQGIDVFVPGRLCDLLSATGLFEKIVVQDGNIPVGFWPQGGLKPTTSAQIIKTYFRSLFFFLLWCHLSQPFIFCPVIISDSSSLRRNWFNR